MSDMKVDPFPASNLGPHRRDESEDDAEDRPRKRQKLLNEASALIKAAKPKPKGHGLGRLGRAFAVVLSYHPKLWHSGLYEHVAKFLDYRPLLDIIGQDEVMCRPWSVAALYRVDIAERPTLYDNVANESVLDEEVYDHLYGTFCHRRNQDEPMGCVACGSAWQLTPDDTALPNLCELVIWHPTRRRRQDRLEVTDLEDVTMQQYFCRLCNPNAERRLSAPVTTVTLSQTAEEVFRPQREANRAFLDRMVKQYGSERLALLSLRDRL
jgi:hypothetical protein